MRADRQAGREKGRFYYCSIRESGIIVRRRKFVAVTRAISISLDAINLDCGRAFIGATNYHHYIRAIAALLSKWDY